MNLTQGHTYANFPLAVWFTVTCSECDETFQEGRDVAEGMSLPIFTIPEGWVVLDGKVYCPKHKVCVWVDDEQKLERIPE